MKELKHSDEIDQQFDALDTDKATNAVLPCELEKADLTEAMLSVKENQKAAEIWKNNIWDFP